MRRAKSERKRQTALTDAIAQCYFLVDEVTVLEEVIRNKVNKADMHKEKMELGPEKNMGPASSPAFIFWPSIEPGSISLYHLAAHC